MKVSLLTIVFLLAGCSVSGVDSTPSAATIASRSDLPELSLVTIAGDPLSIRSWPGRPLVINFWGSWCAPCVREVPLLKEFQSQHPSVQVVGIAVDNVDAVREFDDDMQFNYPIMIADEDAAGAAAAFGQILAVPFTVVTASNGSLIGVHTGEIRDDQLLAFADVLNDLEVGRVSIASARARLARMDASFD